MALLDRQWAAAIELWQELATFARAHGVERLAFELHPLHLVYNVPTLRRMRDAVGPIIGANVDPSHLFWQQMDPLAVIRALGPPSITSTSRTPSWSPARSRSPASSTSVLSMFRRIERGSSGRSAASAGRTSGPRSSPRSRASATTMCCRSRTRTSACRRRGRRRARGCVHAATPRPAAGRCLIATTARAPRARGGARAGTPRSHRSPGRRRPGETRLARSKSRRDSAVGTGQGAPGPGCSGVTRRSSIGIGLLIHPSLARIDARR